MSFCYMPILKWKQGEQIALKEFDAALRHCLLPIIEFLPIKIPASSTFSSAIVNEFTKYEKKLKAAKFEEFPIGIDTTLLYPVAHSQTKLLVYISHHLAARSIKVIPVIHPGMILSEPVELAKLSVYPEVILRVRMNTLLPDQLDNLVDGLNNCLNSNSKIHVLLDMHDIVGSQPEAKVAELTPYVAAMATNPLVTSVTIAGGSFPMSLSGLKQGITNLPRIEWKTYTALRAKFKDLKYGDYTVTNPVPLEGLDPTKMNPSVQIRYTRDLEWHLLKGGGSKTYGMGQYNQLASILVGSPEYCGPTFSFGDKGYDYHAQPGSTSGSYMTWRRDATNHHLVFTGRQLKGLIGT